MIKLIKRLIYNFRQLFIKPVDPAQPVKKPVDLSPKPFHTLKYVQNKNDKLTTNDILVNCYGICGQYNTLNSKYIIKVKEITCNGNTIEYTIEAWYLV